MPSALDKVLSLTRPDVPEADDSGELLLAARTAGEAACLVLASDPDNDGDDDSSEEGDTDDDAGHTSHGTFKKLKAKGMPDKLAAKMCAKADKQVKASAHLATAMAALVTLSVTQAERDKAHAAGNSLPDKSYPINNVKQLHAAAVLAASGHGDVTAAKALIRRRAKELGVDVKTLPGFGDSDSDEKVAATVVALTRR
jgi:hypothetical protein